MKRAPTPSEDYAFINSIEVIQEFKKVLGMLTQKREYRCDLILDTLRCFHVSADP